MLAPTRPAVASLLLAVPLLSACGADSATEQASAAATRFLAAVHDPARACALLAPGTREEVGRERPCPEELTDAGLRPGQTVRSVDVAGHSARAMTSDDVVFLALFDDGWRVTAAARTPPSRVPPGRWARRMPAAVASSERGTAP